MYTRCLIYMIPFQLGKQASHGENVWMYLSAHIFEGEKTKAVYLKKLLYTALIVIFFQHC